MITTIIGAFLWGMLSRVIFPSVPVAMVVAIVGGFAIGFACAELGLP